MGTLFPAMHSTLAPDAGMVSRDGRAHDLPEHTTREILTRGKELRIKTIPIV